MLSRAQSKKLKTKYEEEERKKKAAGEREVNSQQGINWKYKDDWFFKEKDRLQRDENVKKAKEITITEDSSLPKPTVVCSTSALLSECIDNCSLAENQSIERASW